MLTVGYDATAAIRQRAGIGRYARELLVALSELGEEDQYRITFAAPGATNPLPQLGPRFRAYGLPLSDRMTNALWQRLRLPLPIELRTGRLDVFHSPDFSLAPSLAPSVVTIHDLAFEVVPQLGYPTLVRYLHAVIPRCIHRARAVIVPSCHTKHALVCRLGTDPDKVHVIREGVSAAFSPQATERDAAVLATHALDGPFLLTVGTLEPRKNLERLLEAFAALHARNSNLSLIIAGRRGWLCQPILQKRVELGLGDAVRFLDDVPDVDLAALYRAAAATVYPSLYEGFGLPALEALACGSPLACSGNSSVPEVAGEAALYFDPWDVDDMVETIGELLDGVRLTARLRQAGPEQAQAFTWARAARDTSALYHAVARA